MLNFFELFFIGPACSNRNISVFSSNWISFMTFSDFCKHFKDEFHCKSLSCKTILGQVITRNITMFRSKFCAMNYRPHLFCWTQRTFGAYIFVSKWQETLWCKSWYWDVHLKLILDLCSDYVLGPLSWFWWWFWNRKRSSLKSKTCRINIWPKMLWWTLFSH